MRSSPCLPAARVGRACAVALAGLAIAGASAADARPHARILGFGFASLRSPDVDKPLPSGAVRDGGTLHGCKEVIRVYVGYRGMRAGRRYALRWRLAARGDQPPTFRYRWNLATRVPRAGRCCIRARR